MVSRRINYCNSCAAPIDGNGFQPQIDSREVAAGGDATFTQKGDGEQPAEPERVLEDSDLDPGIKGHDSLTDRRKFLSARQHGLQQRVRRRRAIGIIVP